MEGNQAKPDQVYGKLCEGLTKKNLKVVKGVEEVHEPTMVLGRSGRTA